MKHFDSGSANSLSSLPKAVTASVFRHRGESFYFETPEDRRYNMIEIISKFFLISTLCLNIWEPISTKALTITNASSPESREGKALSLFQVIQFQNGPCSTGGTRNGTCYTSNECTSRGGASVGSCANGFGICCAFALGCGDMSSENCTYLVQSTTSTVVNPCKFTICPANNDICRLRFDFTTFMINGPITASAVSNTALIGATNAGGAIGDCTTDTFSITSPRNFAPPVICGFNTGQHMIVDVSPGNCNDALFSLRGAGTRNWDIKVTQYACGDEQAGPDGCLQYFTGLTGTVASFNFPTNAGILDPSTTHLSNQCQNMCWRQEMNTCGICWIPVILGSDTITGSFGVSTTAGGNKGRGETDGKCRGDFLLIPDAQTDVPGVEEDTFIIGSIGSMSRFSDRLCGRFFSTANDRGDRRSSRSVCSQQRPFRMTFKTDENEVTETSVGDPPNSAKTNELNRVPGGIVGFNLQWTLQSCT
ncbi:uncharacterized protein LOC131892742 [Tigriopus californicus]|uniref:uncharacterized protein LOC131892742 n=1 Tax=Tigriopus californicus TaxID=6832 RepID=UPI0027DA6CB5|nr:uncharacterized protein LOC131892742 [Tigriopus californicus]